jgi:hypothetical protein
VHDSSTFRTHKLQCPGNGTTTLHLRKAPKGKTVFCTNIPFSKKPKTFAAVASSPKFLPPQSTRSFSSSYLSAIPMAAVRVLARMSGQAVGFVVAAAVRRRPYAAPLLAAAEPGASIKVRFLVPMFSARSVDFFL